MRLPARPSLINSTPPWTLGQGWTHASGRRCTPGLIHRMTQGQPFEWCPGVDVAPSPERGGHHPCRRVAEMRRRPGSTCSIFKSDRADPGPSTKTTRSPDSKAMGGCGAAEIDRRTDVAHDLHRRGLARNRPRGCPDGFLQLRSSRPFIHRRAVRAVRHLAESPPCPASAVQNPRAAAGRHPYPATTAATTRAMAPPCPPHPPDLPGPPR